MAGAIAETIAPHSEADPVAILAQLLVGAGAIIGRGAWAAVEATRHHPNEFVVLVGDSAKARKGSSWDHVERVLHQADASFAARVRTGLSTGEGLIWAARDPDGTDTGAPNPRLLVVEPEFVSVLKATGRDINTLSPVLAPPGTADPWPCSPAPPPSGPPTPTSRWWATSPEPISPPTPAPSRPPAGS